jgi:peptidoglycan/xylan/chitin deacetylase (PgdA/CDA1 family)
MPTRPHTRDHRAGRRRRTARRGPLVPLGVALLAVPAAVVLAAVLLPIAPGVTRRTTPSTGISHPSTRLTPVVLRHSPLEAQLAAVERLAAIGLPIFCGGRSKPMVALTFDDGPGPYTRLAIAKLRKDHLHATFFLVGKSIRAWPRVAALEKAVAAVGDHTLTHPFLPALPLPTMIQEIAGAKTLIERAARQPVVLFRPPYGGRTPQIDAEARALGMLEVRWNIDSADSLGADYIGIEHNVIAGLRPGAIILMHENRGQTIRALPTIFTALRRKHLRAVSIPQLVAEDPPSRRQLRAGWRGCS